MSKHASMNGNSVRLVIVLAPFIPEKRSDRE